MKKISIIIPSKDEERTIAKCIESVLSALEGFKSFEIILVDSYSSDRTVEIAKKYPIRILRLQKHWPKSPHAGRYLGAINSNSRYIFYLDADMAVHKDWIKKGLNVLEENEDLAGVTGVLYNVYPSDKPGNGKPLNKDIGYVDYLPGAAIFRSDVLKKIKHFNPFLYGYGEKEVGYRITEREYKLIRLKDAIAYHFTKEQNLRELQEKSRHFIGVGQFLRLHFTIENLYETAKTYPLILWTTLFLLMFLISFILSVMTGNFILPEIITALALFLCIALIIRHKNIKKSCLFIYGLFSKSVNIVYGFLKKTKKINEYPLDVEIIK